MHYIFDIFYLYMDLTESVGGRCERRSSPLVFSFPQKLVWFQTTAVVHDNVSF